MNALLAEISRHGYLIVFAMAFGEAVGFPVPAALAMVGAGAAVASHALKAPLTLGGAIIAMLLGDVLLYILGRKTGWTLLGFLCRLSMNPESCILRSAESFYKRGKVTLIFAKFIPGINTMAPPLAGSMRMRFFQFLRLDFLGTCLYLSAYFALGYVFRDFLASITHSFQTAGHVLEEILVLAVIVYVIYRLVLYQKNKAYRVVPRVQVQEVTERLAAGEAAQIIIADVRSHGYYDGGSKRIQGSIRIEPNNLDQEVERLPKEKDIYLYCT